jgi:RimJ/RimL family protein N-acetyltransferase
LIFVPIFLFTRIELTVREANINAIALYKNFGFETEGLHRKAVRIEGRYENTLSMAFVAQP